MLLLKSFCTWYSLRMGSFFVGTVSFFQDIVLVIFTLLAALKREELASSSMEFVLNNDFDFIFSSPVFEFVSENPSVIGIGIIVFHVIYISSCLLLMDGCRKVKIWKVQPYVVIEFIRIVLITLGYIIAMIAVRNNVSDINVLLVSLIMGGFLLLSLYYCWLCTLSFLVFLYATNRHESSLNREHHQTSLDYWTQSHLKTISVIRAYNRFHDGNLPRLDS